MPNPETWWDDNLNTAPKVRRFVEKLKDSEATDRAAFRAFLADGAYRSVIDCGGGPAIDWFGARRGGYTGRWLILDSSESLIAWAKEHGAECRLGSIMAIPSRSSSFDLAYTRHVFQHLPNFNPALSEMIRVARKVAYVQFQRIPANSAEMLRAKVYRNTYALSDIAEFLDKHEKVEEWKLAAGGALIASLR